MERRIFEFEGRPLPSRISMGALRRFRKETDRDFLKIQGELTGEDLGVMLWCAIKSQTKVEGVPFDYSLDDFLDRVSPDEVSHWYVGTGQAEANEEPEESKKKTFPE